MTVAFFWIYRLFVGKATPLFQCIKRGLKSELLQRMDRMRVLQGPLQIIYKNILILFVIFAHIPFVLYLSFFVYFSPYTPLLPSRIYLFLFISLTHSQLNCLCWFMFPVPLVGSSVNAHKHLNWNLTCEGKSHIRMSTKLFPSIH